MIFLLPNPMTPPHPAKKKRQKEGEECKLPENITMKHTNDGCHLTQHAKTGVPPTKVLFIYTQTRQ